MCFDALGRREDALASLRHALPRVPPVMRTFVLAAQYVIDPDVPRDMALLRTFLDQFKDPEGLYYLARTMAKLGDTDSATLAMKRSIERGYLCYPTFASDTWLDPLRGSPEFEEAMDRARRGYASAIADFRAADGERILGVSA
jgi:hypothetical protein